MRMIIQCWLCAAVVFVSSSAFGTESQRDTLDLVRHTATFNEFIRGASQLAESKSHNRELRTLSETMTRDYSADAKRLRTAATEAGISPSQVDRLDEQHAKWMVQLTGAPELEFDSLFKRITLAAHWLTMEHIRRYASRGETPSLKTYALGTLPILEAHYRSLQDLSFVAK